MTSELKLSKSTEVPNEKKVKDFSKWAQLPHEEKIKEFLEIWTHGPRDEYWNQVVFAMEGIPFPNPIPVEHRIGYGRGRGRGLDQQVTEP